MTKAFSSAILFAATLALCLSPLVVRAASPEEHDARMAWWRDARFGMFIHWGLYAIPAGEWNGKPVPGIGEWILAKGNIPLADYVPLAKQFNPTGYDPQEWAQIAADAGIKYVVITSKHHDGFCLFDTAATDWDVVDATPYGKDLLAPLAAACRARGIHFCTYYSIMDWHHPSQRIDSEKHHNTHIDPARKPEYIAYMKQQLRELLDSCDPDVLWFDGEWVEWWTEADGKDLYAYLRDLKPSLIINNRVGKGRKGMEGLNRGDQEYAGDFGTPEQQIPETGIPGVDWESCMTMNDTWGFKKNDHNWKSSKMLIEQLIDTSSKGGNYLLNVGPTAEGRIPAPSVERLAALGRWMRVNGEAIYGSAASPIASPDWGRFTAKRERLYAHVFETPASGQLVVPCAAENAVVLGSDVEVTIAVEDAQTKATLPELDTQDAPTVLLFQTAQ
ncbi:alpha-L-fucosidase [Botrimarina hoheduenensis]|uniref:alpha-L-fucosidase n=1 Tax=Botrimarina hoheduenensis TaxID=2528000 RepID=A0A5C5WAF8_9BACT|nr:alpha-L-fucosidase [Botrimarina hoheduenensis]TWT47554.1 Alpha-L-fucosidase [Botrimarina hoheduenensis]